MNARQIDLLERLRRARANAHTDTQTTAVKVAETAYTPKLNSVSDFDTPDDEYSHIF